MSSGFDTVVEEGPVRVSFSRASGGRVVLHISIDFSRDSRASADPSAAATQMGKVIAVIRRVFRVSLSEIKV
jgi:hypothetical protein